MRFRNNVNSVTGQLTRCYCESNYLAVENYKYVNWNNTRLELALLLGQYCITVGFDFGQT